MQKVSFCLQLPSAVLKRDRVVVPANHHVAAVRLGGDGLEVRLATCGDRVNRVDLQVVHEVFADDEAAVPCVAEYLKKRLSALEEGIAALDRHIGSKNRCQGGFVVIIDRPGVFGQDATCGDV